MLIDVLLAIGPCRSHHQWAILVKLMGTNLLRGAMSQGQGFILLCLVLNLARNFSVSHPRRFEGLPWDLAGQVIAPTQSLWRIVVGSLRECASRPRPIIPVLIMPT